MASLGGFLAAAEHPLDAAGRIKPDDHVGALVDGPDVVVHVDAHAVGKGPGIETLADLADEIALGGEFEQLGCGRRIGWTAGAIGAREHEDVALGVHGHTGHFAKIHAVRQLREIRLRNRREFEERFAGRNSAGQDLAVQDLSPSASSPRSIALS
ncbi:MAG: hypothetical protein WDN50_07605 [Bradyrhizobium sp.]